MFVYELLEHSHKKRAIIEAYRFDHEGKSYDSQIIVDTANREGSLFRKGTKGLLKPAVKALQALLNDQGYNAGKVDGWYGKKTADAVRRMQKDIGTKPDGDVGPKTAAKMIKHFNVEVGTDHRAMNDIWLSKHSKFNTFDDFLEDFKTRYIPLYNGLRKFLKEIPMQDVSGTISDVLKYAKDGVQDAYTYIQMAQNNPNSIDTASLKDMMNIYSNIPYWKKYLNEFYTLYNSDKAVNPKYDGELPRPLADQDPRLPPE